MKYLSNFGQEIDGQQYSPGDEINAEEHLTSTLDYLAMNGKVTKLEDQDEQITATGTDGVEIPSANETTDTDGLDDQTVTELKALAEAENIDLGDATKKADIVAAIRAARAG